MVERIKAAWSALTGKKALVPLNNQVIDIINAQFVALSDRKQTYIKDGYQGNDLIYSILQLISNKCKMPEWGEYVIEDEQSYKEYKGLQKNPMLSGQDFVRLKNLRYKALKPAKSKTKISDLLEYPNENDCWGDFVANGIILKLLTGDKLIWADLLGGGANQGYPNELWLMPPQLTTILAAIIQGKPIVRIIGYQMSNIGLTVDKSQVLQESFFNPDWNVNGTQLIGQSPLKAGLNRLSRNNSAVKAAAAQFENRGIQGVVWLKNSPGQNAMSSTEAKAHMETIKRSIQSAEYSGPESMGKSAVSGWEVGWTQIGLSPVDLNILNSELHDLRTFCNIFGGVPSQLLNDPDNKVYNNMKEGETAFTLRCVMPELISTRNALNRKFHQDWGLADRNRVIDFDHTCFSELEEDMKEKVAWVNQIRGLSPNRRNELLGLEKIQGAEFDEPWITIDMGQPLSQWQMNDVDEAINRELED